jgi:chloramphenicol 3-O phosphotransferase
MVIDHQPPETSRGLRGQRSGRSEVISEECPRVLVLNGGSSSGKSTLARSLQDVLHGYWLRLGVDTLIEAAPAKLLGLGGLELAADGSVGVGADFVEVERQWRSGIAAMAAAGAHILVEDNFVSGPVAQQRWQEALSGIVVGWVGVRCAPHIAAAREAERVDRIAGMAASQADSVHIGITYDLVVDTGGTSPEDLALVIRHNFCDCE